MTTTLRLATDQDGPAIGKLFTESDYPDFGVDWSAAKVRGWWLVAEADDGRIVGAVQVILSQPFGYLGEIVVHPDYRAKGDDGNGRLHPLGRLAWDLYTHAFVLMRRSGVEFVMGVVRDDLKPLQAILKRYGGTDLGRYTLFARRLR